MTKTEGTWWWKTAMHLDDAVLAAHNALALNAGDTTQIVAFLEALREGQARLLGIMQGKGLVHTHATASPSVPPSPPTSPNTAPSPMPMAPAGPPVPTMPMPMAPIGIAPMVPQDVEEAPASAAQEAAAYEAAVGEADVPGTATPSMAVSSSPVAASEA